MAPAAAVDSASLHDSWSDEMEANGDLELASSSGNGAADHGWRKVTNPKKQRLRERKLLKAEGRGGGGGGDGLGQESSEAFEALEKEADARRERRKSRKAAWSASVAAATAPAANGVHHGSDDDEEHSDGGESKAVANGEKKKAKKPKKAKVSIADAAAAIDTVDLAEYFTNLSGSDDVQLTRCVDYFINAFSTVNTIEISLEKLARLPLLQSIQVPIEDIPDKVCRTMGNWLGHKRVDYLSQFVFWALNDVLFEPVSQKKGGNNSSTLSNSLKIAVLVILALLLRRRSDVLLSMLEKLRQPGYRSPIKIYAQAWMFGQVAREDIVTGLYLWSQNLLPLAVGSASTPVSRDIALQFFESFVMKDLAKNRASLLTGATRKERLVSPDALIACLKMAHPPESSRTKATQRFLAIYPTVKEISLGGSSRTKSLKSVAQQLLPLSLVLAEEDNHELSAEGCDLFRWCLFQSPECYKQWAKLHPERLKGSVCVLKHLRGTWKESASMLSPLKELKSTVAALKVQSLKLKSEPGLEMQSAKALDHCRFLEKKMSFWGPCWNASFALAFTAAAGYGFYLMNPNNNPWGWDGKILLRNL